MKQLIILINRLVTYANVAIAHRSIAPGNASTEPVYAVVRVRQQSHIRK